MQDGDHFFDEGYPYTFHSVIKYGRVTKQQVDDMADRGNAYSGKFERVELRNILPIFGDIIMFE